MYGVLAPHNDLVPIKANFTGWDIQKLDVDEGSVASLFYSNCWQGIKLNFDHII